MNPMPVNPFIELARDPVAALAWLGYGLLMLLLVCFGLAYAVRQAAVCVALADRTHRQRDWWGDYFYGWLPPPGWLARAGSVVLVLSITSLALSAFVWLLS